MEYQDDPDKTPMRFTSRDPRAVPTGSSGSGFRPTSIRKRQTTSRRPVPVSTRGEHIPTSGLHSSEQLSMSKTLHSYESQEETPGTSLASHLLKLSTILAPLWSFVQVLGSVSLLTWLLLIIVILILAVALAVAIRLWPYIQPLWWLLATVFGCFQSILAFVLHTNSLHGPPAMNLNVAAHLCRAPLVPLLLDCHSYHIPRTSGVVVERVPASIQTSMENMWNDPEALFTVQHMIGEFKLSLHDLIAKNPLLEARDIIKETTRLSTMLTMYDRKVQMLLHSIDSKSKTVLKDLDKLNQPISIGDWVGGWLGVDKPADRVFLNLNYALDDWVTKLQQLSQKANVIMEQWGVTETKIQDLVDATTEALGSEVKQQDLWMKKTGYPILASQFESAGSIERLQEISKRLLEARPLLDALERQISAGCASLEEVKEVLPERRPAILTYWQGGSELLRQTIEETTMGLEFARVAKTKREELRGRDVDYPSDPKIGKSEGGVVIKPGSRV